MARAALSKVVTEAIRYLGSVRNYAPTTLDTYQVAFDQFVQFLRARGLPDDVRQFDGDNVLAFVESLAARKKKTSTIVMRLNALSAIATTLMKLKDGRKQPYLAQN